MSILNMSSMLQRLGMATDVSMNDRRRTGNPLSHLSWSRVTPMGLYFAALVVVAFLLFVWQAPQVKGELPALALFIALNIAAGMLPIRIYGDSIISVALVLTLAIVIIFGAPGAVIVGPIAALVPPLVSRRFNGRTIPNAALFTIVNAITAFSYAAIAPLNPDSIDATVMLGLAVAVCLNFFSNAALLSVRYVFTGTLNLLWQQSSWLFPYYVAMGVVALALVAAYIALGVTGVLAFVTPAFMLRFAMKQYVDKTEENVRKLNEQNAALRVANVQIKEARDELRESYDGTLEALVNALDARDQETKGHSLRVSRYMMDIARELGVKEGTQEWLDMQRGSLLHDVGKIGVSDNILLKPGKLTDEEWESMRQHPQIGFNMLRQVKFLSGAAEIVYSHHERWDGKGYPRGLAQEEIPLGARIFPVVDTFDSMTSDRPYRKALSTLESMNEILKYSGSQFDPLVVEAFLDIYDKWVREHDELHNIERAAA